MEVRGRQRTDKRTYQAKLLDLMDGVGWLEERTLPTPLCNLHSESPLPRLLTLSPIKRLSPIKPQCSMTPIPPPRPESNILLYHPQEYFKPLKQRLQPQRKQLRLPSLVDVAQGSTVLAGRPLCMEKEEHPVMQALERRLNLILSESRHKSNISAF